MARGNYSLGKRQREAERARKKRDKAQKRQQRRETGPGEVEVLSSEQLLEDLPTIAEVMRNIETRPSRAKGSSAPPCRLFIGGLSWDTEEDQLRAAFGKHGEVLDAAVVKDRATGQSRGFGFITMESPKVATKAIEALNETELDGRVIIVKVATERAR
jgi:RNA recognition motif-containing protein